MQISGHLEQFEDAKGQPYWRIRINYGKDVKGRRVQRYEPGRYAQRREAERALARILAQAEVAPPADPARRTVAALVTEWLESEQQGGIKPKTLADYECVCRIHVVPQLGAIQARRLTASDLERWRKALLAADVSTSRVARATLHLSQALKYGIRHGYIAHNPTDALKSLRHAHREMQVWTAEQAQRFLAAACANVYHPYWLLALHTGMRRGELLALEWDDLDWEHCRLAVRRGLDDWEGLKPDATKTGRARTIDLDPYCLAALKEHRVRQGAYRLKLGDAYRKPQLLIASTVGDYISPRNVTREMAHILASCDVPRIRLHDLRHTAATLMLANGEPIKVVSERLGHASVTVTMNIYAHTMPNMQRDAAARLGRLLAGEG